MGLSSIKKMCRYFLVFVLFVSVIVSSVSCIGENDLEEFFAEWEAEIDSDIAIIDYDAELITIGENSIDMNFLRKNLYFYYDEVFAISNGLLYGYKESYNKQIQSDYNQKIEIFTIDLETAEAKTVYSGEYCSFALTEKYGNTSYAKIYYKDKNVIIYDQNIMTFFNLDTHIATNLSADSFVYPYKYDIGGVRDQNGDYVSGKIRISTENEERILSVDYVAERHEYAKKITEIDYNGVFAPDNPFSGFFNASFEIGENIYFVFRVFDVDGDMNGVVFSYNYEADEFSFLYHSFTCNYPSISIIPVD